MESGGIEPSLWKEALLCQESTNILSVANAFVYSLRALHEEQSRNGQTTDWIAGHPITRVFAARLLELSGPPTAADREAVKRGAQG